MPAPLSEQQRALQVESFDMVWDTIRRTHPDPKLNGADWEGARAELRPKVEAATTADDARDAMTELLRRLKQTHFGIIPAEAYRELSKPAEPAGETRPGNATRTEASTPTQTSQGQAEAPSARTEPEPGVSGLTIRVVDGRALVTAVRPSLGADRAGVKPGWIIKTINGRDVQRIIEASKHGGTAALKLALASRAIDAALDGPIGTSAVVEFLDGEDRPLTVTLERDAPPGSPARFGNLPTMYVELRSDRLDGSIGYIALSIFLDPARVSAGFNNAMSDLADTQGMILDLRGNIGGIGAMAIGIGGYFVDQPNQRLGTMRTRDTTLNFVLNPRAQPYAKPLAVLVDECSLSTSEILAGGLKDLGRARVFGSPTGGAALPSVIVRLPSGDAFQYATAEYTSVGGAALEGIGITPDQVVQPDRATLLAGKDPVVEAAKAWIRSGGGR